jgi:hypothetical protein
MRIAILVTMLAAACDATAPAASFAGSWNSTASEVESCTTGTHTTSLAGTLSITAAGATVTTHSPNGCNLNWTVSGESATLAGNQTCTVPGSVGGTWTATFTSGTMVLSGNTISLSDSGTGILDPGAIGCTFTQSGPFVRN